MTTPNMSERIVSALQLEPMTIRQIARALTTSEDRLRVSMRRLEDSGRIRRSGFAAKTSRMGTTPYLWRAA